VTLADGPFEPTRQEDLAKILSLVPKDFGGNMDKPSRKRSERNRRDILTCTWPSRAWVGNQGGAESDQGQFGCPNHPSCPFSLAEPENV